MLDVGLDVGIAVAIVHDRLMVMLDQSPDNVAAHKAKPDHADLLDTLKGLGLTTTAQVVNEAVAALYPNGVTGIDQGDVVRKVFLHLQAKKK